MPDPNLNPYNFVPLDGAIERSAFPEWHRLEENHLNGELVCDVEVLTPLFTADHQKAKLVSSEDKRHKGKIFPFLRNGDEVPIVQGATIRGMIRAVYEAAFTSCMPLVAPSGESRKRGAPVKYDLVLPPAFERCTDAALLCPACRLFGVIEGEKVHVQGRVSFSDAVLVKGSLQQGEVYLRELSSPKPHHYAIYSKTGLQGGPIRGRKLFYHHDPGARSALSKNSREWTTRSNAVKELAPVGTRFRFRMQIFNLGPDELQRLVGCLLLDQEHAHKLGMAKPQGYGSCRIHVVSSRCWQGAERYRSWSQPEQPLPLKGWTPPPGELERLLRYPGDRHGTVGYLPVDNYRDTGIDEEGRFIRVSSGGPARTGSAPPPSRPAAPLATLNLEALQPARNPAQERPGKRFKKGDSAKIVVLRVEEPNRRYILKCKESGQDDIVFEGSVSWQEGDRKVVKVATAEDGRIKSVRWP